MKEALDKDYNKTKDFSPKRTLDHLDQGVEIRFSLC